VAFVHERKVLLVRRPAKGLLGGMWELPAMEMKPNESEEECLQRTQQWVAPGMVVVGGRRVGRVHHVYSHFKLNMPVNVFPLAREPQVHAEWESGWFSRDERDALPLHQAALKALELVDQPKQYHGK
jgi:A/G-specific adenine glycosylase